MDERGVTEGDIQMTLNRPVRRGPGNRPDTIEVVGYCSGGRRIKVIVDSADNERIVTVIVLSEGVRR